jgi:HEPN domain-containing protein
VHWIGLTNVAPVQRARADGEPFVLTEFTKTKISFMLALLGMLFALHPVLSPFLEFGYDYLGVFVKVFYAYTLTACLLSLGVYFYGVALMTEQPHSWLERLGNSAYALAIIVPPLFGGLYVSSVLAHELDQSHLAWAAPSVAAGLGILWLVLTQLAALLFRHRLGEQDRQAKIEQFTKLEVALLERARSLFSSGHYDLSIIESAKALESRLRRVFLIRKMWVGDRETLEKLARRAIRKGILQAPGIELFAELERDCRIAMSNEPLTKEAAIHALSGIRHLLAIIPLSGKNGEESVETLGIGPKPRGRRSEEVFMGQ